MDPETIQGLKKVKAQNEISLNLSDFDNKCVLLFVFNLIFKETYYFFLKWAKKTLSTL